MATGPLLLLQLKKTNFQRRSKTEQIEPRELEREEGRGKANLGYSEERANEMEETFFALSGLVPGKKGLPLGLLAFPFPALGLLTLFPPAPGRRTTFPLCLVGPLPFLLPDESLEEIPELAALAAEGFSAASAGLRWPSSLSASVGLGCRFPKSKYLMVL